MALALGGYGAWRFNQNKTRDAAGRLASQAVQVVRRYAPILLAKALAATPPKKPNAQTATAARGLLALAKINFAKAFAGSIEQAAPKR